MKMAEASAETYLLNWLGVLCVPFKMFFIFAVDPEHKNISILIRSRVVSAVLQIDSFYWQMK